MKGTDKLVLASLAIVGLLAAFYFMILAPKREEASKLGDEVTQLEASIDQQNQVAQFAEQARQDFPRYYSRLVVLGKAAPADADSASLLVQLSGVAERSGVDFRGLILGQASGGGSSTTSAPATTTTPTTPASGTATTGASGTSTASSTGTTAPAATGATSSTTTPSTAAPAGDSATSSSTTTSAPTAASPAPATEATAATLPIGAVVGPAGLPTLPYDLKFTGTFFDTAEFMAGLDSLVQMQDGQVSANGRLLTVDGFSLSEPTLGAAPKLKVDFAVTSYVVPGDQGLTAGASPGGPAPSPAQPQVTPVADQ